MGVLQSPFAPLVALEFNVPRWYMRYSYQLSPGLNPTWDGKFVTTYDHDDPMYDPTVHPYYLVEDWDQRFIDTYGELSYDPPYKTRKTVLSEYQYERLFGYPTEVEGGQYTAQYWHIEIVVRWGIPEEREYFEIYWYEEPEPPWEQYIPDEHEAKPDFRIDIEPKLLNP